MPIHVLYIMHITHDKYRPFVPHKIYNNYNNITFLELAPNSMHSLGSITILHFFVSFTMLRQYLGSVRFLQPEQFTCATHEQATRERELLGHLESWEWVANINSLFMQKKSCIGTMTQGHGQNYCSPYFNPVLMGGLWMAHFLLVPEKVQARGSAKVSNGFNQFEAGQSKCWEHTRAVSVLYVILWSWRLKEYLGAVAYWKCSTRSNPNFPSCTLKPTGLSA